MILIFEAGMLMAMRSRNNIFDALVVSSVKSKQLASDNEMLANLDPLTGLPNRRHFFTDLKTQQTHKRRQPHTEFAVGIIDIDRFKVINDSFGHRIGDLVLIEIGKRLQPVHRHLGTAQMYRIGGDVFAFIQQFNHTEAAVIHGKTIIDTIERTIMIDCIPFNLSASIGIAFLSAFENTPELIYEYAGHALTHAKHAGRGQVACFSNAHFEQLLRRKNIEKELRIAIEQDQLYPVFQPIQHLPTGKPLAFECLARWHHPHLGTVDPDVFIGIAENIGLISNVTVALFSKALVEVQRWPDSIDLSFNLSANDIMNEALIATITKMILRSHIGAERFTFEITETGLLKNFQTTKRNVERLKSFGCNIALDDFGTGYSSLSHVQELPLHKIKIDKRFVRDIETNAKNRMIVSSIFGLSQGIQIECVIEGAETASQIAILKDLGCTQVQGYYYSMPLSAKEVSGYLEAHL